MGNNRIPNRSEVVVDVDVDDDDDDCSVINDHYFIMIVAVIYDRIAFI